MAPTSSKVQSIQKETYNEIGTQFSASRGYIWPDLKPFLADVKPNSTVLDVGCGNGRLLLGLPETVEYTGIDFSTTLLEKAVENHPFAHFLEGDITKPEAWQGLPKFDYIFSIAVIHHLASRKEQLFLLKQIKDHLKLGGKCLITAWNLWQPKLLKHHLDFKTKVYNHHFVYIPFQGKPRFHFAHTKPYLEGLLREVGLSKLVVEKSSRNYLIHD
jgi:SAM-dependent methyltransferase